VTPRTRGYQPRLVPSLTACGYHVLAGYMSEAVSREIAARIVQEAL